MCPSTWLGVVRQQLELVQGVELDYVSGRGYLPGIGSTVKVTSPGGVLMFRRQGRQSCWGIVEDGGVALEVGRVSVQVV